MGDLDGYFAAERDRLTRQLAEALATPGCERVGEYLTGELSRVGAAIAAGSWRSHQHATRRRRVATAPPVRCAALAAGGRMTR